MDIEAYENGVHGAVTRKDLNIQEDAFVVGMVGRMSPQKAPDVFVKMAKKVKDAVPNVPSRNNSRVARAPQSFWLDDILSAHEKMLTKGITNCIDSCTMMQECGFNLHLVDGPGENIKITTPEDFYTMRAILEAKENAQIYGFDE